MNTPIVYPTNIGSCPICRVTIDRDKCCPTCAYPNQRTCQAVYRRGLKGDPYHGKLKDHYAAGGKWRDACMTRPPLTERVADYLNMRLGKLPLTPESVRATICAVISDITPDKISHYALTADEAITNQLSVEMLFGPELMIGVALALDHSRRMTEQP